MADHAPLTAEYIEQRLDEWLEVEFTFLHVQELAATLAKFPEEDQSFLLKRIQRIATTHVQIAYQFAIHATKVYAHMDRRLIEAWITHAMDTHDRTGLTAAIRVIKDVDSFARTSHERAVGVVFEDIQGVLLNFVHGLSGRQLKMQQGEGVFTDSETLTLPAIIASLSQVEDNFKLAKAMVALLWAQTRYGSFRVDIQQAIKGYADPEHALRLFHLLETLRLEACLKRELPGLYRDMQRLKTLLGESLPPEWTPLALELSHPASQVEDSWRLLARIIHSPVPPGFSYQGELKPALIHEAMNARMAKEKILLRIKLAQILDEIKKPGVKDEQAAHAFEVRNPEAKNQDLTALELTLDGIPLIPPDNVAQLLTSIQLDWGEVPPEFLIPAGPGEFDPALFEEKSANPDDVWQGTYHEEGASFYPEWDYGRQHYRKNWCVMREQAVKPVHDGFRAATLSKYSGLVKHLRKTFEAMRDENRLEKRQTQGDNVDIDALVEALADARDGSEMSDRLFMRMHRAERNIAVMFMVDMSGSTRGWINDAERESLILLCEALETLEDRYAIYGFSGMTRKRCELYRIKTFDEAYDETVQARISGIRPQDYTRMGFAIRHLTGVLNQVEARTKLLITLSDGKPDDYHDNYRTQYGIEDTRKALQEAQRSGIHPFCITIDETARDYLPHLYGAVNYTVIDEVRKLPLKVADIYRRLTT